MPWDGSSDSSRPTYWVFDESPYTRNADDTDNWLHSTKLGSNASRSSLTCHRNTFETARLLLRPVTIMDVDAIFGSYAQDEEVVRYLSRQSRNQTGGRRQKSSSAVRAILGDTPIPIRPA